MDGQFKEMDRIARGIIQIVFLIFQGTLIGLKLAGALDCSWLWVLFPLWCVLGSFVFLFLIGALIVIYVGIKENKR